MDPTREHTLDPETLRCDGCGMDRREMIKITPDLLSTPLERIRGHTHGPFVEHIQFHDRLIRRAYMKVFSKRHGLIGEADIVKIKQIMQIPLTVDEAWDLKYWPIYSMVIHTRSQFLKRIYVSIRHWRKKSIYKSIREFAPL